VVDRVTAPHSSALDVLASRCGIEASFRDARGETHRTSPETRRSLLAAMGITAEDDETALKAIAELDRLDWEKPLPPVCVLRQSEKQFSVDVSLPAGTEAISWRITLEDSSERRGGALFESLDLLRRHESGGTARERRRLLLSGPIPFGYHSLNVEPGRGRCALIVTPGRCWLPSKIENGQQLWGVTSQLYLLRSSENWGIGDYGDLRQLVGMLVSRGADVVGLNPLHALFLDDPEHASPYSPASRLQLNVLNIDVGSAAKFTPCAKARRRINSKSFRRDLTQCREAPLLDYSGVVELKLPVLRLLFESSRNNRDSSQWQAFEAFRRDGGQVLERGCLFQALREYFAGKSAAQADWRAWPHEYRDPRSPTVARFAETRAELVTFHAWLQFIADAQLGEAAEAAKPMAVGLYRDLAVGADPSGAETWANQTAVVTEAQVGAPPDIYNPAGQDWGLPPFNPRMLRDEAYRSFIDLVRANMRHAGGLRIDHVMGLQQLYWVPKGQSPTQGAYVRYPLDDLVGILALESHRHRCLVVGEDLGTVPEGLRERLAEANILSYRVLFFEKDESRFAPPNRYPRLALAVTGSHDLPTLRAWWEGTDLNLKEELHLFPTPEHARGAWEERKQDREKLVKAFRRAGLTGEAEMEVEGLIHAAHAYLARSKSALAVAQIDDICDEAAPVNVPSTSDEYPNWRRRQSLTLEQLAEHPRFASLCDIFRQERSDLRTPHPPSESPPFRPLPGHQRRKTP